ncbi:MAG: hypothetical protein ACOCXG_05170 [Nanoarchaeota archaeon]
MTKSKIDLNKEVETTKNHIKNFRWFKNEILKEMREEKLIKYSKIKKLFPDDILIPVLKELQNENKIEIETNTGFIRSND